MKVIFFFGAFVLSIFVIKSFYEPKTQAQVTQESTKNIKRAKLGLISKKRITDNIVETATVWEELYRVKGGVVKIRTSVHEYEPDKFITSMNVNHHDLDGKKMYTRMANSHSKTLTINYSGIEGWSGTRDGKSMGATVLVDFKSEPSDQCFRNRIKLLDMPKVCNAAVRVSVAPGILRLKMTSYSALLYSPKGKIIKNIKPAEPDYSSIVNTHLNSVFKEANLAGKLDDTRL